MLSAFNRETWKWHHLSATTLENFSQCERYVFYEKPLGLPKPPFKAQLLGVKLHAQVEHLVDTGQDLLDDRLKKVRQFLPEKLPAPNVFSEYGLDGKKKSKLFDYESAPKIHGLPLEGYLDYLELRPDLILVKDLKTTKSIADWAKTEEQLRKNLQLGLYAWWATLDGWVPVQGAHVYAQTEGAILVKEVPVLFTREDVEKVHVRAQKLAEGLLRFEGIRDEYEVAATGKQTGRCEAYGGCPFRARCFRTPQEVLRARIGISAGASNSQKENSMSLQDRLAKVAAAKTEAPKVEAPPAQAAPPSPPPAPMPAQVEPLTPAELAAVQSALPNGGSWNRDPQGNVLCYGPADASGTAPLVARLEKKVAPPPAQIVAAPPIQRKMEIIDEPAADLKPNLPTGIVPPDAPPNDANAKPEEKKRGRGRPPKSAQEAAVSPVQGAPIQATSAPASAAPEKKEDTTPAKDRLQLYVNCLPLHLQAKSLAGYAEEKAKAVAEAAQVPDYRLYPEGAVKGKGMLAALVRAEPPAPGAWFATGFTFDSPLGIVVETLQALADEVTRGV